MKDKTDHITKLFLKLKAIDLSIYDDTFLYKSLQKRITETKCNSEKEYYSYLEQNKNEAKVFINSLHIAYSEFFRNPLTFAVLEQIILPSLVLQKKNSKQKEIRIWSAACASGEEVYSMAILLEEYISNNREKIKYRLFASDQNESHLKLAQKGVFSDHVINNLQLNRLNRWFSKLPQVGKHSTGSYSVKPELNKHIDFSVFDLFNEQLSFPHASIFGNFDLVLCANLLFYYKPELQNKILEKVSKSLTSDGYLVVGETERNILINNNYHEVYPQSAIFKM